MPGTTRRKVLIGAGALAAAAVASPVLAAGQPSKTGVSGKAVVMTDPNGFNDKDVPTLQDAGKRVYWGFVHSNNDGWIDRTAMNILAEKNQTLYSADFSKLVISGNPEATKVIRYLYDLAADGVNQTPIDPSPNWMGADFNEGQIALLQYGYWFSAMAESDKTKGKTVFLPAPTWSGVRRDPTMTETGWVVSSQTKDAG